MSQILNEIQSELSRLNKQHWWSTIVVLHTHYQAFPFDADAQAPAHSILKILQALKTADDFVEDRFVYRLHQLHCFTWRAATKHDGEMIYWNPLEEPYTAFKQRVMGEKLIYQSTQEYPSTDIIRHWIYRSLKDAGHPQ